MEVSKHIYLNWYMLTGTTMARKYLLLDTILKKGTLERDTGCYARLVKVLKLDRILSIPVVVGEG